MKVKVASCDSTVVSIFRIFSWNFTFPFSAVAWSAIIFPLTLNSNSRENENKNLLSN